MFLRWLARGLLTVAGFFAGSLGSFFLVFSYRAADSSDGQQFPTLQDWSNIITTVAGLAVAASVWVISRRVTRTSSQHDKAEGR